MIFSKKKTNLNASNSELKFKNDSLFNFGKSLFKTNCASCHYIGMDKRATAIALGGITKKRNKGWLYDYTRKSYEMLIEGDSIAKSISSNGGGLMTSFPNLSDSDLDHLYYFVEERYKMSINGISVPIEFGFNISENKRAKACIHIISEEKSILKVSVSNNRIWKFSCGKETHVNSDFKRTTLKKMFQYDNSINDLIFLTMEFPAKRTSKTSEWE